MNIIYCFVMSEPPTHNKKVGISSSPKYKYGQAYPFKGPLFPKKYFLALEQYLKRKSCDKIAEV